MAFQNSKVEFVYDDSRVVSGNFEFIFVVLTSAPGFYDEFLTKSRENEMNELNESLCLEADCKDPGKI